MPTPWRKQRDDFALPYHPNVTMGWDSSPRTVASDTFENAGYPFMPTLCNGTPHLERVDGKALISNLIRSTELHISMQLVKFSESEMRVLAKRENARSLWLRAFS